VDDLPLAINRRIRSAIERLAEWPNVSNVKAMKGEWKGHYRMRVGDYRILFQVINDCIVVRIQHRKEVYN